MRASVIVIGGGGHSRVLIDTLQHFPVDIVGITDPNLEKGRSLNGVQVIGNDDDVFQYSPSKVLLVNGLGSTRTTEKRRSIYELFKREGYSFHSVIHPSAMISTAVQLSEGVQIMAGAILQAGTQIGSNSIINTKVSVDHDCKIGDHVHIAPGATLSGGVCIEDDAHVGTGAVIIQGIRVRSKSLVGAGAVVVKDVISCSTVVGVPAREVRLE